MINFKIEKFEGPLSLLLQIIEKEEMDITEISLAKIADQYVEYIRNLNKINPEEMADFLVVAARLLLIKSKALLPYLYPEEEAEIEELELQLKMYKEYIDAMKKIEKMLKKKKFMFAREFNRKVMLAQAPGVSIFSPPKKLTEIDLRDLFRGILGNIFISEKLEEKTIENKVNIEDKIMMIQKMLLTRIKTSFNKVVDSAKSKTEIIVSFLAMLELIKQRNISVRQDKLFDDILINKI